MGFIDVDDSTFLTGSDSAASFTTAKSFRGKLHAIQYVRDSTGTAMSTAASLTVTAERSGIVVLGISAFTSTAESVFYPRHNIHSTAGSTVAGFDKIPLYDERLQFVISSGGATKGGRFRTFIE